jgi:thiol-disulfide isomerase/thioredoxin
MASTISKALKSKNFDDQYTWLIPEKDPTNGGKFCLDPSSDAFKKNAGKLFKVIATKDGIKVFSQAYPSTEWKDEPSFCPAKGGSAAKTITMHVFTASWCRPCQTLKAKLQAEKARLARDGITLAIIEHDIDSAGGKEVAKRFRINTSRIPVSAMGNASGGMDRVDDALASIKQAEQRIKGGK